VPESYRVVKIPLKHEDIIYGKSYKKGFKTADARESCLLLCNSLSAEAANLVGGGFVSC
jgi:hypothetical protein